MQNVTVSATALITRTSIAVVRNVQIPTLSKTVESWFNLFSVIQIDKSWSSCALSCLLKRALGLVCFIYFILLWEQLLSFLKFLFLPPFKPWAVIVFCFFFPLIIWSANMPAYLIRIPMSRSSVHFQGLTASSELSQIYLFIFLLSDRSFQSHLIFCTQPSDGPSVLLNSLFNFRLWHQAL